MLALVEGPSDVDFFRPLLDRCVNDLAVRLAPGTQVAVDVRTVRRSDGVRGSGIEQEIETSGPLDVIALHFDGTADPARERARYFEPVVDRRAPHWPTLIALAPVREMEAWAMADPDQLRRRVGRSADFSTVLEGDRVQTPERLTYPKRTMQEIFDLSRRRGRRPRAADALPLIAENISLSSLRRLPSFAAFESELIDVFQERNSHEHPR